MLYLVKVVTYVVLVYMVQKYLVDLRDKSGVFGFEKIVDDFGYKNLQHLVKSNSMYNKVFYFYSGFAVYCFNFAEKMDSFHLGLVKLVDNQ